MATWFKDLRIALRQLGRRPWLPLLIVLIMAIGIGVNAAVFSVVYAVLLKPLPYPSPDKLFFISGTSGSGERMPVSYPDFRDWHAQQHTFEEIAAYNVQDFNLVINDEPEHFSGAFVSANFFRTMGLAPKLGRTFLDNEDQIGSERVIVLGERLWREQFSADPSVIGRTLIVNSLTYEVVGVAAAQLEHPSNIDLYASFGPFSNYPMWTDRSNPDVYCLGQLKQNVTPATAAADLKLICKNLESRYPITNAGHSASLTPLLDNSVGEYRETLYLLFAAAALILLIVCANISGLLLGRGADRRKELTIRTALGASRGRIVSQLLIENLLLSLIGGLLGILTAHWSIHILTGLCPQNVPRFHETKVDGAVIIVMTTVTIGMGLLSALIPAWKFSQITLNDALKERDGATGSGGSKRSRTQAGLVVGQVAVVTAVLASAGLLIETLQALHRVRLGFDPHHVLVVGLKLPGVRYRDRPPESATTDMANLYHRILQKVESLPGVDSAAINTNPPFSGIRTINTRWTFGITGRPDAKPGDEPFAEYQSVSPDYFRTVSIPLLRGRAFDAQDVYAKPQVVIVDENFVDRFFPNEDPIGQQINDAGPSEDRQQFTVVGIIPTVRHEELRGEPRLVQVYVPLAQSPYLQVRLLVHTNGEPLAWLKPVREAVLSVDPELPVFEARTMDDNVSTSVASQQLAMTLISFFAILAWILAVIGLYGMLAYTVSQRASEIGIRVTLGASRQSVIALFIREGMALVGTGLAIGLLVLVALGPLLGSFLYHVAPYDPITLGCVSVLFSITAFLACLIPALRAANVNPLETIRQA
jgi:putative ABC transport system permease protein